MSTKYYFLLLLLFGALHVRAQSYYILQIGGTVMTEKNQVQENSELDGKFKLVVPEEAFIALVDETGKCIRFEGPKQFTAEEIDKTFKKEDAGITSPFFAYLWKNMNKKKKSPEEQDMKSAGGVVRGDELMLLPQDSVVVAGVRWDFSWEGEGPFTIELMEENRVILSLELNTNEVSLNPFEMELRTNKVYTWRVQKTDERVENLPYYAFYWYRGE